jgi:predicted transcriptional regulator
LIKEQLIKLNFDIEVHPQYIKVNSQLIKEKTKELQMLLKEFKDVFAWIDKDLKGIPLELAQQIIELDTSIPPTHQGTN